MIMSTKLICSFTSRPCRILKEVQDAHLWTKFREDFLAWLVANYVPAKIMGMQSTLMKLVKEKLIPREQSEGDDSSSGFISSELHCFEDDVKIM